MSGYIRSCFPEDREFELLPEGEHVVRVEAVSQGLSKSGNEMVTFELKSIPEGQLLWHYCLNVGENRWMLKKTIQSIIGVKQPSGPIDIAIDDLVGRKFKVIICHEVYQGKKNAKVKDVVIDEKNPLTVDMPIPIDEDLPF